MCAAYRRRFSGTQSTARSRHNDTSRTDPAVEFAASAEQQLRELIRQQYNHASIAMWAVDNESTMASSTAPIPTTT
jgi:beta-galactosidase/beta-glucuronidase